MDLNIFTSDPFWRANRHTINVDFRAEVDTDIEDWATPDDTQISQKFDDGNTFGPLPIFTGQYRDEITPLTSSSFDSLDNSPPFHHSYFQSV